MTDTKLNETIPETTTAELDLEKQYARIESVKHKTDFVIGKLPRCSSLSGPLKD